MKKHHRLLSISSLQYRINQWHVLIFFFKGKSLVFRSWTSGNLGYFLLSFLDMHHPSLIHQRGPSPKTEKDVEPCIFHDAFARNEYVLLFTFKTSLPIDALVPIFYDVSYKVPSLFTSLSPTLSLSYPKLRDVFARRTKDGPQEVYSCLILFSTF